MLLVFVKKVGIFTAFAAALALIYAAYASISAILDRKTFYSGITIEDINISGLTLEEAQRIVSKGINEKYGVRNPRIIYGNRSWELRLDDISHTFKLEELLNRAYTAGRTGSVIKRLIDITDYRLNGLRLETENSFDSKSIRSALIGIKQEVDAKESNASIDYKNGKIEIFPDTKGYVLDVAENLRMIESRLANRDFSDIKLKVNEVRPKITYEDIADMNNFIASFTTTFNAGDANRSYNIRYAGQKINNTILMPKDVFSMDRALGPRTEENGYKVAHVIYLNELVDGTGGGVCQVTSTLYGAVLRSNADVIERSPHSLPLAYVQPGQDATVAENYLDFKFQNNFDHPIAICTQSGTNNLTVKIASTKPIDYVVKLKSHILQEFAPGPDEIIMDDSVPPGEKVVVESPKRGYRVEVYKEIYDKSGQLLKREKISEDVYKPQKGKVKMNSGRYENVPAFNEIFTDY